MRKFILLVLVLSMGVACSQQNDMEDNFEAVHKEDKVVRIIKKVPGSETEMVYEYYLGEEKIAHQRVDYTKIVSKQGEAILKMEGNLPDGIVYEYHPTGELAAEIMFVGNKMNGAFTQYYEDGSIAGEGEYKDDMQIGIFVSYSKDGNLQAEVDYEGKISTFYYEGGGRAFEMDMETGNQTAYYKNGVIKYEMNMQDQAVSAYDESGNLYPQEKLNDKSFMEAFMKDIRKELRN